jgi:hypothetical protein
MANKNGSIISNKSIKDSNLLKSRLPAYSIQPPHTMHYNMF